MTQSSRFSRIGAGILRYRIALMALCVGVAVALITASILSTPLRPAVVATRQLHAGDIVTADAVVVRATAPLIPPDAVTDTNSLIGQRTLVDIPPGTPVRFAYVRPRAREQRTFDTISLPVNPHTAGLLSNGDYIDIYAPSECEVGSDCGAVMLTHRALVLDIDLPDDSGWNGAQSASLVIGIDPADTSVVAGVPDPTVLTIVLLPGSDQDIDSAGPSHP
ncbi:MAG: SAF domain-containing protein [Actinomycetaceae bacterium]|nr:SAF domain-containing protein [Actinomycetaceae bacterium]